MPIKKKVTLIQIATELNLTVHTVSKSLRGLPGMSEETRHIVIETARRLGYRTKEQERSLSLEGIPLFPSKVRRFIFLIASEQGLESVLHRTLLESIQSRLAEAGHKIEICFLPNEIKNDKAFAIWVKQQDILYADGLFISPSIAETIERKLITLEMPRILLNFPPTGAKVDSVIWNVFDAMQQSVHYLLSLGHRRILYIGDIKQTRGYKLRWMAFCSTLEEAGMEIDATQHMLGTDSDQAEWSKQWLVRLQQLEPTALLCATQEALTRTYVACHAAGITIPADYSLLSLEPESALSGLLPNLTRPSLSVKDTGYRAVDRMLWRIANPSLPYEHIVLQGDFHTGTTVTDIRQL
jgi:LacI family transcriptional regulator